ncbi:MAG TPA: hypothetical protein VL860_11060 [Planctomycetota bacterium]|nr:hypothetical protein [Planctomycetota bacterium]
MKKSIQQILFVMLAGLTVACCNPSWATLEASDWAPMEPQIPALFPVRPHAADGNASNAQVAKSEAVEVRKTNATNADFTDQEYAASDQAKLGKTKGSDVVIVHTAGLVLIVVLLVVIIILI